ncbi:hypothetical protein O181_043177 [Austropuccinia psidii MF-1]|uniref:Uncharacterized protein n=1 Tax=Austropuccinia psidii MF-1 TaxID=1389203 RepID=A0A9Q3DPA3_9BASI|nr:hypothetical protein [Austropuccinia psidii MF-1]
MTIVHKAGNVQKNSDGLSRWALPNTNDSPAYVPLDAEPQIPIEGINISDIGRNSLRKSDNLIRRTIFAISGHPC